MFLHPDTNLDFIVSIRTIHIKNVWHKKKRQWFSNLDRYFREFMTLAKLKNY